MRKSVVGRHLTHSACQPHMIDISSVLFTDVSAVPIATTISHMKADVLPLNKQNLSS
jgi:uncharacterized protein (UPF0276 family)